MALICDTGPLYAAMDRNDRDHEACAGLVGDDYSRVRELLRSYADLPLGFVDAAVVAVTERLGEPKLATLDYQQFTVVRPRHVDALRLLPGG